MKRIISQLQNVIQITEPRSGGVHNVREISERLRNKIIQRKEKNPSFKTARTVVYFGEQHEQPQILSTQLAVMVNLFSNSLHDGAKGINRHLVLEQFNVKQQHLLNQYAIGMLDKESLSTLYQSPHTIEEAASLASTTATPGETTSANVPFVPEGHSISHYSTLLDLAKELGVKAHGGFPPRGLARYIYHKGISVGLPMSRDCFPGFPSHLSKQPEGEDVDLPFWIKGDDAHFKQFSSTLEGVINNEGGSDLVNQRMRTLFDAQVFKDSIMAAKIFSLLANPNEDDVNVLAITGSGHMEYGFGVPQRVQALCDKYGIEIDTLTITSRPAIEEGKLKDDNVADYVFFFEDESS